MLDIAQTDNQFLCRRITVDTRQRRIDRDIATIGGGLKYPFNGIFKNTPIAPLSFQQCLLRFLARCDILYIAFQTVDTTVVVNTHASLPYPAHLAIGADDTILKLKALLGNQTCIYLLTHERTIFGMRDLLVGNVIIKQQGLRLVAGQGHTAFADELHGPVIIGATAIYHAIQMGQQCLKQTWRPSNRTDCRGTIEWYRGSDDFHK